MQYPINCSKSCQPKSALLDFDKALALNPNDHFAYHIRALTKYALETAKNLLRIGHDPTRLENDYHKIRHLSQA